MNLIGAAVGGRTRRILIYPFGRTLLTWFNAILKLNSEVVESLDSRRPRCYDQETRRTPEAPSSTEAS